MLTEEGPDSVFKTVCQRDDYACAREMFCHPCRPYPAPEGFLDLEDGAAVEAMLTILGLEVADIKLVFVNSRNSGLETVLADGDQVGIFPAVGGG